MRMRCTTFVTRIRDYNQIAHAQLIHIHTCGFMFPWALIRNFLGVDRYRYIDYVTHSLYLSTIYVILISKKVLRNSEGFAPTKHRHQLKGPSHLSRFLNLKPQSSYSHSTIPVLEMIFQPYFMQMSLKNIYSS